MSVIKSWLKTRSNHFYTITSITTICLFVLAGVAHPALFTGVFVAFFCGAFYITVYCVILLIRELGCEEEDI